MISNSEGPHNSRSEQEQNLPDEFSPGLRLTKFLHISFEPLYQVTLNIFGHFRMTKPAEKAEGEIRWLDFMIIHFAGIQWD
jgi:hypothetical protein